MQSDGDRAGRGIEVSAAGTLIVGTGSDDCLEIGLLNDQSRAEFLKTRGLTVTDVKFGGS